MGKDKLVVINNNPSRGSKLPPELPPNLIYWIRCETRVKPCEEVYHEEAGIVPIINDEELRDFYNTRVAVIDSKFAQSHHPMKPIVTPPSPEVNLNSFIGAINGSPNSFVNQQSVLASSPPQSIGVCCMEEDLTEETEEEVNG